MRRRPAAWAWRTWSDSRGCVGEGYSATGVPRLALSRSTQPEPRRVGWVERTEEGYSSQASPILKVLARQHLDAGTVAHRPDQGVPKREAVLGLSLRGGPQIGNAV